MFRGLINDAKSAAGSLVARYLARASVAVPFIVALGFAIAAVTLMLVERFGHVAAYWMLAGGFTLIGVVATLTVRVKEQEEEVADQQAAATDTAEVATDSAAQAAVQLPIAALGALFTTPGAPGMAAGGARMLARNWALLVLVGLLATLFWPKAPAAGPPAAGPMPTDPDEGEAPHLRDMGYVAPAGNGLHREAA